MQGKNLVSRNFQLNVRGDTLSPKRETGFFVRLQDLPSSARQHEVDVEREPVTGLKKKSGIKE